jgi:hypothetical protein
LKYIERQMVKLLFVVTSIFLILVIFLKVPQESLGLAQPSSFYQQGLNIGIGIGILIYFTIAIKLNFGNF